jgi:muramoyltetrapeptide carboxypeptidase LdcA involved in peptidoglycan recycling
LSANELLRYLDYDLIKDHPKIFCGYSDITLLYHAIFTQTGLHTFYGPAVIPTFGEFPKPLAFSVDHFPKSLQATETPIGPLPRSTEWAREFRNWMDGAALANRDPIPAPKNP